MAAALELLEINGEFFSFALRRRTSDVTCPRQLSCGGRAVVAGGRGDPWEASLGVPVPAAGAPVAAAVEDEAGLEA
jgi:hypothetical protein